MSIIVTLTSIFIRKIEINYSGQFVEVYYNIIDANGITWIANQKATFYVTMPDNPTSEDYQLPENYITLLVGMRNDAKNAIIQRVLNSQ